MSTVLINEDTLLPGDSFRQLESLCDESFIRPKIFLNDLPVNITLYDTESDPSTKVHNMSFLSKFDCQAITTTTTSVQLYKSHANNDEFNNTLYNSYGGTDADADTKSSAYFSDTSHFLCKSHEDGYEFQKVESMCESSMNSSGFYGSLYKMRDTLESCSFRRKSPKMDLKEPSTPTKRNYLAQRLDISAHDSVGSCSMSGTFSQSYKSVTVPDNACEMEMMDELKTSTNSLVTSSPIDIDVSNGDGYNYDEPVNLNNTLERVNNILAEGGFKTPSPTRMLRRKRLMEEYVKNLKQHESPSKQIINGAAEKLVKKKKPGKKFPTPKSRKPTKRTISVDEHIKTF